MLTILLKQLHSTYATMDMDALFCADEITDLIKSWHLNGEILQILNDRGILSCIVLQNLEMKDVEALFDSLDSKFFGEKIKFKSGLTEWRNLMNIPLRSDKNTESINSKILSRLEKLSNDLHTIKCREYTPIVSEANSSSYNVFDLLKSTVRGRFVLKFHEQNGYIDNKHQRTLTHCIAESYIGTGRKMCYSDMKQWANAICQIFPKEKPETYYLERKKGKKNPSGKLYSRWVNSCVKTAKSLNNESETEEEVKFEHKQQQETSHEVFLEKKCWLMNNSTPWEQVKLYWKETYSMRLNCKTPLKDLLTDWPRYKDSNGYELVELDFETMYPGKTTNQLFLKLDNFYKKIVPIFRRDVKDAASREVLLSKLDLDKHISNDSKYCITLLLLHCILQPLRRNRNEKPTIADAQNDFLALVSTPNDIKPDIFVNKKDTLKPRIVVVGADFWDISEFYIYCDDLKWKCSSFMKCIEYIIKLSHVFQIEYAHNSKQVWTFLEQYFFELKSEMFPAVSSLLGKLDLP